MRKQSDSWTKKCIEWNPLDRKRKIRNPKRRQKDDIVKHMRMSWMRKPGDRIS